MAPRDPVRPAARRAVRRGTGGAFWLRRVPLFVLLIIVSVAAMGVPMSHAAALRDWETARTFLHAGILIGLLSAFVGLATARTRSQSDARDQLITLVATFTALPALLALPFHQLVGGPFLASYVEMVSSLTTTGVSLWLPHELSPSLHLWRATVGWMGGLFVWIAAVAILAPMNLGGFEVIATAEQERTSRGRWSNSGAPRQTVSGLVLPGRVEDSMDRLLRIAARLLPIYVVLTGVLWMGLTIAGETPLIALCHAMATLSTSGISPVGGVQWGTGGRVAEMVLFVFFIFAITRFSFALEDARARARHMFHDPEARMGLLCVLVLPTLLFLRHFFGAGGADSETDLVNALRAFWGGAFTVLSFLTTTGFESTDWVAVRNWSGLQTPGLILMGLALVGGGVATTAGGVKLLRVYALYKHGVREMERLVHPSSVGGAGRQGRGIRREGALVAWVFFMLFALSLAAVGLALAATGIGFEQALILAVTALATCGPLTVAASDTPILLGSLPPATQVIMALAMVLGRLETLALLALLNPGFWRR